MRTVTAAIGVASLLAMLGEVAPGAKPLPKPLTLAESLAPYAGPTVSGVDTSTLYHKVMCGYQGWFSAADDGYGMGNLHWGGVDQTPPRCSVDFWPDLSELDEDEKFPTNYKHADGSVAYVFSSTVAKTVHRHFKWMQDYGIDGAFVQRFTSGVEDQSGRSYQRACAVLHHCREAANRYGRAYAVMYDTDFDRRAAEAIRADWSRLVKEMRITSDARYLRHQGGPIVSLWGYGFDHRKFDPAAAEQLFEFLKRPENGACTIMLGVPNDWATWQDERMRLLLKYVTIISPWTVGRYQDPASAKDFVDTRWPSDLTFCQTYRKDYYPVAFPGFSWTNLKKGESPLNSTPRSAGRFFWSQIELIKNYNINMAYVAMFDEVDEGTAIFKCTNNPPVGQFCTLEGLPSDYYLQLAGNAGRYLRGDLAVASAAKPAKRQAPATPGTQPAKAPAAARKTREPPMRRGSLSKGYRLVPVSDGDGTFETVKEGTIELCRGTIRPSGTYAAYMYFRLPDNVPKSKQPVYVEVKYRDRGTGRLELQYNAAAADKYRKAEVGYDCVFTGQGQMHTAVFQLAVPDFQQAQNFKTDLRLAHSDKQVPLEIVSATLYLQPTVLFKKHHAQR